MKKAISIFVMAIFMVSMVTTTASAYGGRRNGGGRRQQPLYELCTVQDCDFLGSHQHDGAWYCGQAGSAVNRSNCTVEDCTIIGIHEHEGTYYRCANPPATGRRCGRGRR